EEVTVAFWQRSGDKIGKALKAAEGLDNLEEAAARLRDAAHLSRLLHGGVAPFDVVQGLRKLRLHDLLLGQAQRTLADHWFEDSPNAKDTYYLPVASAYVKDALELAEAGKDDIIIRKRQTAARDLKDKVQLA